ncbi:MAG: hypothetical protein ACI89T_000808 [Cognaticolwellia sp.]|jgi:hypothetical protein
MMFQALTDLYTLGDLDKIRSKFLHSSSWKQHEFTAYGNAQIENIWLKSLEQFGFSKITQSQFIEGKRTSALYLELVKDQESSPIALSILLEHNQTHIKKVRCILDTKGLAKSLQITEQALLPLLPTADPLLISQFDHQLHPQSYHAVPSDICSLPPSIASAVETWWHIWQANQVASFNDLYAKDADIFIAGKESRQNVAQLRNYKLYLNNRLGRNYCQLESISVDEKNSQVVISWQIDGDFQDIDKTKRLRVSVHTHLTIENGKITAEKLLIDWLAIQKRFQLTSSLV